MPSLNLEQPDKLAFRIDNFAVPETARGEFEAQMQKNLAFIQTLPGFRGQLVLEKSGGASRFNVATIVVWESREAIERAAALVRAHYQAVGFDGPRLLARLGIEAELGNYHVGSSAPALAPAAAG